MGDAPTLKFYNTLTREKTEFQPIDSQNVRMYVCGPTVYDFAHIGNARPVIVFDVLFRLLRHVYGENHVTYVRNITDVDDKINARALRDFPGLPLNDAIRNVTEKTEKQFLDDAEALGCLSPNVQPRATDNIVQMIEIIQRLLDRGNAYVTAGTEGREVLFSVPSMPDYGQLSKRKLEDQQAGARIAVEAHKRNPGDFVLWKESAENEPGWHAEFVSDGQKATIFGRPGWHIECSAMSQRYLGETFDVHGGGLDLIFPHHENEIAQSRCANGTSVMANVWMHNGFLQVEGKKMSKSEGNFVTIAELLHTEKFGGRSWSGRALKLAMLMTHYRQPIDWTANNIKLATQRLSDYANLLDPLAFDDPEAEKYAWEAPVFPSESVIAALCDDLNTSDALMYVDGFAKSINEKNDFKRIRLAHNLRFLGLLERKTIRPHKENIGAIWDGDAPIETMNAASKLTWKLKTFLANNAVHLIEDVTSSLSDMGFDRQDDEYGGITMIYRGKSDPSVDKAIAKRLEFLKAKNFPEADKIRDELLAQGIQLKDGKDPVTGERVTTWELKR